MAERISYLGYNIPPEVKNMIPVVQKFEQSFYRDILSMVALYMKTKKITLNKKEENDRLEQITDSIHNKLTISANDNKVDPNLSSIVFTGLYYILKIAIKKKVNNQTFLADITDLKLPQPLITDLSNIYNNQGKDLAEKSNNDKILFPKLETFKWRVDVIISSSFTSRVLIPVILMEMADNNGKTRVFEVSVDTFHKLRYNVAKVLKDLEDLEQNQIISKLENKLN
ncbi:hypothetical protein DICPUDRAFT_152138 [Dictyostelium purpureum]|uniref:COMM domain-containing protein 5 n=1 Tax=Dictyostelium purpureum TaxID=5786 RepID=F0ZKK1_DICPU|nr:uncharacterized protein DICPUDRAFT_152138 [Dictyostelium purpureum]EGC35525.1 hypothetical protein DICPUDRAFT_152138 [Dictyostelium purpureum]|eukprot:XP_003287951.1 hypothetical protein DICPUDRAFT_152138 [Dictyostelium purpureum]